MFTELETKIKEQDAFSHNLLKRIQILEENANLGIKTLSVNQAAEYKKVKPTTIRKWFAEGKLTGSKTAKLIFIDKQSLDNL